MGHEDLIAIRRIIFLEIIFRDLWTMDMDMDYGHGQYVIRMYVFSLHLIISSGLQESISCLDFKVYVTRGF